MAVKKDTVTGKWYYYGMIKTIYGQQKQYKERGFKTKAEAIRAEQIFRSSFNSNPSEKTLDELYEEFILYSERKKASTVNKDKQMYHLHIQPYFGNRNYLDIKVQEILQWQQELLNEKHLTPVNINNIMKSFSKYYGYTKKIYLNNYNPISLAGRLKEPKRLYTTWDQEEFSAFIREADSLKFRVAFHILYFTGIRRGELLALRWTDYDARSINISKNCSQIKGGYVITEPKTGNSYQIIELGNETIRLLDEYKATVRKEDGFMKNWYILGNTRPLPFNELGRQKDKYEKLAHLPHIYIQDFRHSHISMLIDYKIPLPVIAGRAGDTINTILKTYAHQFKNSQKQVMDALNSIHVL